MYIKTPAYGIPGFTDITTSCAGKAAICIGNGKALAAIMMRVHSSYSSTKVVPMSADIFSASVLDEMEEQSLSALLFAILFEKIPFSPVDGE